LVVNLDISLTHYCRQAGLSFMSALLLLLGAPAISAPDKAPKAGVSEVKNIAAGSKI